jgi:hypothetical protein
MLRPSTGATAEDCARTAGAPPAAAGCVPSGSESSPIVIRPPARLRSGTKRRTSRSLLLGTGLQSQGPPQKGAGRTDDVGVPARAIDSTSLAEDCCMAQWSFHARVLICIAHDPGAPSRYRRCPGHHRAQRLWHCHRAHDSRLRHQGQGWPSQSVPRWGHFLTSN